MWRLNKLVSVTWSLARLSLSRMWEVTILSVSSRSIGKHSSWKHITQLIGHYTGLHSTLHFYLFVNWSFIHPWSIIIPLPNPPVKSTRTTLVEHWRTVLISSWMTMSTHLTQGPFSFMICFFTMASNAMSGVKSPVLKHTKRKRKRI